MGKVIQMPNSMMSADAMINLPPIAWWVIGFGAIVVFMAWSISRSEVGPKARHGRRKYWWWM